MNRTETPTIPHESLELIVFGDDEMACQSSHKNITGETCTHDVVARVTNCEGSKFWCKSALEHFHMLAPLWVEPCRCGRRAFECWHVNLI